MGRGIFILSYRGIPVLGTGSSSHDALVGWLLVLNREGELLHLGSGLD